MDSRKRAMLIGMTPAKAGSDANPIPSSSPAFATPSGPIRPAAAAAAGGGGTATDKLTGPFPIHSHAQRASTTTTTATATAAITTATILPVLIPPGTLRPLAFRVFTKRHNLTLQTGAMGALAAFVGRQCGSGWRDEGLAERVLDEAARRWKRNAGPPIVEGGEPGSELGSLLKELAACMAGGRVVADRPADNKAAAASSLSRQSSFGVSAMSIEDGAQGTGAGKGAGDAMPSRGLDVNMSGTRDEEEEEGVKKDPRQWLKVVDAFEQPRLTYNPLKRHFEKVTKPASIFPDASTRTAFYKQRYHMVHQRLMRNESFQAPTSVAVRVPSLQRSASSFISQQTYKLSNVTDLLGRSGSSHILLGLLSLAPAGHYAISDLSGSITLDLSLAVPMPDWAWIVPGMMVIVDGTYEEEGINGTTMVGSNTGIGGTIGGKFVASSIAGPPAERREKTLGVAGKSDQDDFTAASGFGWIDFLGTGSEKAVGQRMRTIEKQFQKAEDPGGRGRVIIMGELNLDMPETFGALRKILGMYEKDEPGTSPMTFVLGGNFVSAEGMGRRGTAGSIEYKESFDNLASTLSNYPRLLSSATFVFVPGDNDPWAGTFAGSSSTTLPRHTVPAALVSRIRRAFQTANADREKTANTNVEGEAFFASNPTRLSLFGPAQEIVILRDDMTGRIRRNLTFFGTREESEESEAELELEAMHVDKEVANEESHVPEPAKTAPQKKLSEADALTARQLTKLIVDQAYLTPFSIYNRPVLWDFAPALHMVPLPTAMVLMDVDAPPFALGYEGCFVMNPGRCLVENRKGQARWIEYDVVTKRGKTMQVSF